MSRAKEVLGVIRGIQSVVEAGIKLQEETAKTIWANSSFRNLAKECNQSLASTRIGSVNDAVSAVNETTARVNTVLTGIREFVNYTPSVKEDISDIAPHAPKYKPKISVDEHNLFDVKVLDERLHETKQETASPKKAKPTFRIKLTDSDRALLKKLDMEYKQKMGVQNASTESSDNAGASMNKFETSADEDVKTGQQSVPKVTATPNPKSRQTLSTSAKQRMVPSSRIGRMVSFGSLAAGLGLGTLAEYTRRSLGIKDPTASATLFLTEANMERIVDTLCKVRGAALKLGQILSIQDESVINPQLASALERVRKSADFMPLWQLEKVLKQELGENWRDNFIEFDDKPFAAASIGEVHWGITKEGKNVAIKIQYPGVAKGIESDIDNLFGVLNLWNIFPEGMFIDNLVVVAKRELAWEVDYIREADCTRRFKKLLEPYPEYYVPEVIDHLTTRQVFTTEYVEGITIDQCTNLDSTQRNFIGTKILELILRELLEFRYMQTDPNWANFLYNPKTRKLLLLDFGATREYSKEFVNQYVKIIKAAADGDRQTVLTNSKSIGFLTGYESKLMAEAHVDAVMILGEMFKSPGLYDFSTHNTTDRLKNLIPTIISHRLCPPPEEVYSLHRKLSGIFALCAKLRAVVPAQEIFLNLYNKYVTKND